MGLLDYYRQFEALSDEEVNEELRVQAQERKRQELAHSDALDLSQTTWPDLPHANIVNAVTFAARSGLQRYPHAAAPELRNELAHRHGVEPTRVALGNGAAQLIATATRILLEPGRELVMPWPSYPLYPVLAARAGAKAVPVRIAARPAAERSAEDLDATAAGAAGGARSSRGVRADASSAIESLLAAVTERTRALVIASPNDPTGELLGQPSLRELLERLPDSVAVLLDQALVDFSGSEPIDAALALLAEHPRLIVFRSFSKAWGLAGLRFGYALGGPGAEDMLTKLEPDLGVGELSLVGALEALRTCSELTARRSRMVAQERAKLTGTLRRRGFEVAESEANFLWCKHATLSADEVASRLASAGVLVASGTPLGEPGNVRITVPSPASATHLMDALDTIVAQP